MYITMAAELRRDGARLTDAECRHVRAYLTRARLFVSNLTQRNRTLQHVTAAIIAAQREFLVDGVRYLKPLSRADVAHQIGHRQQVRDAAQRTGSALCAFLHAKFLTGKSSIA